ncbi:pyruvate kinase [Clostridium acetireducens DSM 10703]|jgi:pyruvate kinase|uniref:Pyruvate kinase n=1 Tax=Clostridium acetireducens DSM 10703 TaxID=1121290 RepID=A0A1E8F298_9CLOT|nr:pyruvate kinase [Clostridium acetireducens]OFI07486.1 pyruvate kinase [Clostridium acetireducens DSM 10703]
MQKTKMIFTIGPASKNEETISKLIEAGMSASRHNFSHGTYDDHGYAINLVRRISKKYNKSIAVVLDTKGPEIRTGNFKNSKIELREGNEFTFYCGEEVVGDENKCSITYDNLNKDVKVGDKILVDDGLLEFEVKCIKENKIICLIKNNGIISNHKGVNVPGVSISLPSLTHKDIEDLKFGCEIGVDIIAASFIRKASDVLSIRKTLEKNGGTGIQIFSKVENHEGVNNIDQIIKFSDGIMIARGDMGVEIPIEKVPIIQKEIIEKCNKVGKPVITATQMLDSMIRNPRPTRAEASDIANAIFDGTDAIMLSGETANGKYPVEAAKTMSKIAETVEQNLDYEAIFNKKRELHIQNVPNAISVATCTTASELNASAIITATQSGNTARMVSKYRPKCPIIAVTPKENVARKLALNWGVFPLLTTQKDSTDELIDTSVNIALESGYVKKGDLVVIAAGVPVNYTGSTNLLKVHLVGDVLVQGKGIGTKTSYGTIKVVNSPEEAYELVEKNDIIVVKNLDKGYIPLIDTISGVISEEGGLTSHLAIECISKEIPVICKAGEATKILKTGSFITMDTPRGIVYNGKINIK